jgi:hypothetical protein
MFHALSLPFHRYVFGSARYQDMLGEPVVHRTDFCYELTFGGNPETGWVDDPKVPPLTATAHLCTEHNCADAECKKYDQEDAAKATPK